MSIPLGGSNTQVHDVFIGAIEEAVLYFACGSSTNTHLRLYFVEKYGLSLLILYTFYKNKIKSKSMCDGTESDQRR